MGVRHIERGSQRSGYEILDSEGKPHWIEEGRGPRRKRRVGRWLLLLAAVAILVAGVGAMILPTTTRGGLVDTGAEAYTARTLSPQAGVTSTTRRVFTSAQEAKDALDRTAPVCIATAATLSR